MDYLNMKLHFSFYYYIQYYLRLKNRKGYEVLNGQDENSTLVYLSFLKLFQNFDFEKKISTNEDFKNNAILHKIDFTDEDKEIKIDSNTDNFFNKVVRKMRAFDMNAIKKYHQKDIDNYFKEIDKK